MGVTRRYAIQPVDGYSIEEAAEVLGVPKRRVRELVARGVILGSQEDDGALRVYLQPRPPASLQTPPENDPGFEASPFRELLTEFRNLTERYGQALLALGESRGEVAALRGRVEALETRMDLRLGSSAQPSVVEWHAPPPAFAAEALADLGDEVTAAADAIVAETEADLEPSSEGITAEAEADSGMDHVFPSVETEADVAGTETQPPAVFDAADADAEPADAIHEADADEALEAEAQQVEPVEETEPEAAFDAATAASEAEETKRSRGRRPGFAGGGIAEALARAIDPSTGELPAPSEVAGTAVPEAVDVTSDAVDLEFDAGPPIDSSRYSTDVEEPDWLAEAEYTWLDAADRETTPTDAGEQSADRPDASDVEAETASQPEGSEDEPQVAEVEVETVDDEPLDGWQTHHDEAAEPSDRGESHEQPPSELPSAPNSEPDEAAETEAVESEPEPEPVESVAPEPTDTAEFEPEPATLEQPEPVEFEPDPAESVLQDEAAGTTVDAEPDLPGPAWDQEWDFGIPHDAVGVTSFEPAGPDEPADEVHDELVSEVDLDLDISAIEGIPPDPDAAEPVSGPLPEGELEMEAAGGHPERDSAAQPPQEETDEVALMWLGSEFDDREEYAAEIEVGTAGWRRRSTGSDELTRIAEDQGWDPTEVDAIRNLLEPASPVTSAQPGPAGEQRSAAEPAPVEPASAEPAPAEPAPAEPAETGDERPTERSPRPSGADRSSVSWPAADHSVTFALPGGDDLQRALEALGLPKPGGAAASEEPKSRARPTPGAQPTLRSQASTRAETAPSAPATPRAQPGEWSKLGATHRPVTPLEGSAKPQVDPSSAEAEADEPSVSATGEPEWLRGRRDPAARAYRRLRRIFPT
jgi:hypothetical protein